MAKIYFQAPQGDLFCALEQEFAKGTQLFPPKYYFGVIYQHREVLAVFTDKGIKIDKKSIPGLQAPLFGKVKDIIVYFYPYGFSGQLNKTDYVFKGKDGKKVLATFDCSYQVEIEDPFKVINFNKRLICYHPARNGTFITSQDFAKYLLEEITVKDETSAIVTKQCAEWANKQMPERGMPSYLYPAQLAGLVAVNHAFERLGYKIVQKEFKLKNLHFVD